MRPHFASHVGGFWTSLLMSVLGHGIVVLVFTFDSGTRKAKNNIYSLVSWNVSSQHYEDAGPVFGVSARKVTGLFFFLSFFLSTYGPCCGMRWVAVGWGMMMFLEFAYQVDAATAVGDDDVPPVSIPGWCVASHGVGVGTHGWCYDLGVSDANVSWTNRGIIGNSKDIRRVGNVDVITPTQDFRSTKHVCTCEKGEHTHPIRHMKLMLGKWKVVHGDVNVRRTCAQAASDVVGMCLFPPFADTVGAYSMLVSACAASRWPRVWGIDFWITKFFWSLFFLGVFFLG